KAGEGVGDAILALLRRAVVGDVADGGDQGAVLLAEAEAGEVELAPAGEAQQLEHAQRVEPGNAAGIDLARVAGCFLEGAPDALGLGQGPRAEEAQGAVGLAGLDSGLWVALAHAGPSIPGAAWSCPHAGLRAMLRGDADPVPDPARRAFARPWPQCPGRASGRESAADRLRSGRADRAGSDHRGQPSAREPGLWRAGRFHGR